MLVLPVDSLLPEIVASLRRTPNLVIEAPPGAGKTTRVPPALLDAGFGEVLVLQPRRIAARLAARRVANEMGESLGETVPVGNAQRAPKLGSTAEEDAAACATESGELAELRANPSRTAALAFAAGLRCRALKPQAERLLESLD